MISFFVIPYFVFLHICLLFWFPEWETCSSWSECSIRKLVQLSGALTCRSASSSGVIWGLDACLFFFFFHPQENQNEISSLKVWFWKDRPIACWETTSLSACPRMHKPVNSWEWGSTPGLSKHVFTAAEAVRGNPLVLNATTQSIVSQHHETISLIISQERVVFFTKLHCNF